MFSPLLGRTLGRGALRGLLLAGAVCTWTVSVGAVLRLCELGAFVHVGPTALGVESSLLGVALVLAAELLAAAMLPVFAVGYLRS